MPTTQAQVWKSSTFAIERKEGKVPGAVVFRLSGPFTARDMFSTLSPDALRNLFESQSDEALTVFIFDLTEVPYMDSMGLGMIVSQHVRCQAKGLRMVAAGVSPRVQQLFKLTKVDTFIAMAATVEDAEGN
jgi:anti-anti-sigma factor